MAVKWKYSLVSSVKMHQGFYSPCPARRESPLHSNAVRAARALLSFTLLEREIPRGFGTVSCQVRARTKCLTFSGAKRWWNSPRCFCEYLWVPLSCVVDVLNPLSQRERARTHTHTRAHCRLHRGNAQATVCSPCDS